VRIDEIEHAEILNPILRQQGLKSLLGVPLVVEAAVIGVLHVGSRRERPFDDDAVALLQRAADRAALAIQGRLAERERDLAKALQRSLIPTLPDLPGVGLAGRYLPAAAAKLGGDWYDAFPLPGGRLGMAIGDIVGRGFHAAALMGQLRSGLRAYALDGLPPGGVLERLSGLLRQLGPSRSATLVYLIVDPHGGTLTLAGAGHPPPLVLEESGDCSFLALPPSVPLGAIRNPRYEDVEQRLEPGSMLVLYTDGLVEQVQESLDDSFERLLQAVRRADGDLPARCDAIVEAMLPAGTVRDDAALLLARALPLPDPLVVRLPAEVDSIPLLRRVLGRWLDEAGASTAEAEDVSLACSEACANAIEHAYAPMPESIEVEATVSDAGEVVILVRDSGSWRAPRGTNRGRGLELMQGLTDSLEVVRDSDGTTVRLVRRLGQPRR
jgi:anti-sigma regulatory factor (Ser/Thr protein kinase)